MALRVVVDVVFKVRVRWDSVVCAAGHCLLCKGFWMMLSEVGTLLKEQLRQKLQANAWADEDRVVNCTFWVSCSQNCLWWDRVSWWWDRVCWFLQCSVWNMVLELDWITWRWSLFFFPFQIMCIEAIGLLHFYVCFNLDCIGSTLLFASQYIHSFITYLFLYIIQHFVCDTCH